MMEMSATKSGEGDVALMNKEWSIRVARDIRSLLVEVSNAYNLTLLFGGSPKAHASYNSQVEKCECQQCGFIVMS
jgi:hypothetical protein